MLVTPDEQGEPIFTAEGCCKFYKENGRYIFQPRWYDPFNGSVRQLYRPKYSPRRFETLLKKYTNIQGRELTLLDTLKPIVVSSFDISEATPFFFVRQAAQKDPSRNFRYFFDRCSCKFLKRRLSTCFYTPKSMLFLVWETNYLGAWVMKGSKVHEGVFWIPSFLDLEPTYCEVVNPPWILVWAAPFWIGKGSVLRTLFYPVTN